MTPTGRLLNMTADLQHEFVGLPDTARNRNRIRARIDGWTAQTASTTYQSTNTLTWDTASSSSSNAWVVYATNNTLTNAYTWPRGDPYRFELFPTTTMERVRPLSADQIAQREAARIEREQQNAHHAAVVSLVTHRAKSLLYSCLIEDQRKSLDEKGFFRMVSNKGNVFELMLRKTHGIYKLNAQGQRIEEWCVLPPGSLNVYDVLLAQKLSLETDEDATYQAANVWERPSGRMIHTSSVQYAPSGDQIYRAVS